MLTIPTDLTAWSPADVQAWLTDVEEDPDVTDQEVTEARSAAHLAIVGDLPA
jgi:hypothetical protein